jgi:spore coat polysaccharide biosynthesis protein SpsF
MSATPRSPRVGVVVQARMGSERLRGKVLEPIAGRPMLSWVLGRCRRARTPDVVVLATTVDSRDDPVAEHGIRSGVLVHRGPEDDVLLRYLGAADVAGLDVVVRVTADCPLVDPTVIDAVVSHFLSRAEPPDYASNTWPRSVPTGLDVEVFTTRALRRASEATTAPRDREHVTLYLKEHPEVFRLSPVEITDRGLDGRWTVDEPDDLAFVRAVVDALGGREDLHWREVLDLVERRPDLARINAHVRQRVP